MLKTFKLLRWLQRKSSASSLDSSRRKSTVVVSHSDSIFDNLALEDWLYENIDYAPDDRTVLFWRNRPCVVIGKFQNQWMECNSSVMKAKSIPLARRKSGGGAVYHDMGNINVSFITHREKHSRRDNLEFICDSLMFRWPHLDLSFNSRHDILLNGKYKVSGTAARMTRTKAYHHCTLLVDSDTELLHSCLHSPIKGKIESNASQSLSSPVTMLSNQDHPLNSEQVMHALADDYQSRCSLTCQDTQVTHVEIRDICDRCYPGIEEIKGELTSWQWVYGRTPKFSLNQSIEGDTTLNLSVEGGKICDITVKSHYPDYTTDNIRTLIGLPFCPVTVPFVISQDKTLSNDIVCSHLVKLFKDLTAVS
ncbi:lipoyl amidotransferase LIPT1, mitochondrial-like [Watersipora subatra]|uniref:lipoyl amidotransferase LIPT1, mitochondrial-like n=1 Tax=Watersipora subatra TaxID=2589382 RepID=UPI00355BEC51